MSLAKSAAKKLVDAAFAATKLDDVTVSVRGTSAGNTRFAVGQPTTNGDAEELQVAVTVAKAGRKVTVAGGGSDPAVVVRVVQEAEALASLAPVDPEHMEPLPKQTYPRVRALDPGLRRWTARERADVVKACIEVGKRRGLETSGLVRHASAASALATKAGLFAWHEETQLSLSVTCRTADGSGSGRAGFVSHAVRGLDAAAVATVAAEKAERSRDPRPVEPGEHTVILEPQAVADLLEFLHGSLARRAADEGRSYFSAGAGRTSVGEKLFDQRITLWSDPTDPAHPSSPVGEDGMPLKKVTWVERGVLRALSCGRYWAAKSGGEFVSGGRSLFLGGEQGTVGELVARVERGILVSRLWYIRMLEPRSILLTGLTRDGTFLVEGGRITGAVKNLRFNESPVTLLKRVRHLGAAVRAGMSDGAPVVVPPLVVDGFRFESSSDAV
jgi:predicted Zn-dependent protease